MGLSIGPVNRGRSDFGNGDGAFRAHFNAGLATQTLVVMHGLGLAALHFEHLSGTSVYALFITGTFVFIYNDLPHGTTSKKRIKGLDNDVVCNLDFKETRGKINFL